MNSDLATLKTEAKQLVTRITVQAGDRSLKISSKLIKVIQQSNSSSVIQKIKAELNDILMYVDLEIIKNPDDYFQAIIHGNSFRQ